MSRIEANVIGKNFNEGKNGHVDNLELIAVNEAIRFHPVELIGAELRSAMESMKAIITE